VPPHSRSSLPASGPGAMSKLQALAVTRKRSAASSAESEEDGLTAPATLLLSNRLAVVDAMTRLFERRHTSGDLDLVCGDNLCEKAHRYVALQTAGSES